MTQSSAVHCASVSLPLHWTKSKMRRPHSMGAHLRRIAIVVLSAVSRTYIPFVLLGILNRIFPTLASVFFCYAGNARYAAHYSYPSCRSFLLWFPSTIGVFRQGRRWGLMCATPITEVEFTDPKNAKELGLLLRRLQCIKKLLGVNQLSFAGILPTVLRRSRPQDVDNIDRDRTSEVVRRAVHQVRRQHFPDQQHTVVLLGGAGRIGRALHERLQADGIEPIIIDSTVPASLAFAELSSVSMILVDVSRHGAIERHIHELPAGAVVLNEVFPEPSRDAVQELRTRNIAAYHIAGVKAEVYPSLPHGYKNAVPCCAIHSDEIGEPVLMRIA
jgi:hypothetical protein